MANNAVKALPCSGLCLSVSVHVMCVVLYSSNFLRDNIFTSLQILAQTAIFAENILHFVRCR